LAGILVAIRPNLGRLQCSENCERRKKILLTMTAETPGWYVVCEYFPPGNIEGDNNQYFIDNVPKQIKGEPSDTVESGITSSVSGWRDARWGAGVLGVAGIVSLGITY
jgi:hypothetical protein